MIPEELPPKYGQRGPGRTLIRGADWVVAWDAAAGRHTCMRGADVAFEGGSLVHVGMGYSGPADGTLARTGLRGFLAPGFASAAWKVASDTEVGYAWNEAAGWQRFEESLRLIDGLAARPSGRLSGIVAPARDYRGRSADETTPRSLPVL